MVKTPERDLSLLLAAVHDPQGPAPELLVRYVDDPDSLSEGERAAVEDALGADPLLAGELRALQASRAAAPRSVPEAPRSARRLPRRTGLWIAAPVAASAAAALFALLCRPQAQFQLMSTSAGGPSMSALEAPRAAAPATEGAPQVSSSPAPEPPALASQPVPPPTAAPIARAAPPSAPPLPPPVEEKPDPARELAAPEIPSEPVALAFLEPRYRPPADAPERYRIDGTTRAARMPGEVADLHLLAPAHVARTRSAAPSLFWSLDALPEPSAVFSLTLSAAMTPEPVLERPLPRPERAGLQRIRLARYGVELEPGVEYTWTISADVAGSITLAQGWIQRVDFAPELPLVAPGELSARYASAGLWYDAVEALADLAEERPDDERLSSALRALAAQARLEPN